jgi:protein-S-isoprenylcysteine O-methyltransferase Ste14
VEVVRRWLDLAVFLVVAVLTLTIGAFGVFGTPLATWWLGLVLCVVFTPPWFLARKELGDAFSARPDARKLVTSGIYSKIRHPVYVFGTPAWVGALLPMLGWQAFVVGLIIVAVEIVRARREERLMAATFGPEYAAYRRSTWF